MQLKKIALGAALAATALAFSGCAYRPDLAQGNFVEQDRIDMLRYGMTAEQVRFILGTPMLVDPFDNSRWYYVHYLREGWDDPQIKNLIVLFSGSVLIDMSGDFEKPADFMDGQAGQIRKITDLPVAPLSPKAQQPGLLPAAPQPADLPARPGLEE